MKRLGMWTLVLASLLSLALPARPTWAQEAGAGADSTSAGRIPPPRPFISSATVAQAVASPGQTSSSPSQAAPSPRQAPSSPGRAAPSPTPAADSVQPRGVPGETVKPLERDRPMREAERQVPSSPEEQIVDLKPAPLEPTDLRFPINLATALRLSDARPLIVAAAQASVWVAEAQLTRAKVLWVPTLNVGFDYTRHDGGGPDFNKGIMTAPSVNFFYGGAGLIQNVALTDVFFEPLVQRQTLTSRQWDIQTAKNDALLMTAEAYFTVHQYRGMFAGAIYTVERGHDLIHRIEQLSQELVPRVEVDRARNLVADLEQQATQAREAWRVHSANLTQVLRLDPRAVVDPMERDHLQITLIDPARQLDDLIPVALTNRPELASHQAIVQAVAQRIRREKGRMLLPSILINGFQTPMELLQAGVFGMGSNASMNQWVGRDDLSYQPLWQLEAVGLGNLARIKEQRGAVQGDHRALRNAGHGGGRRDSCSGPAPISSGPRHTGRSRLRTAIITFNGNFEGLHHTTRFGNVLILVNRPQEVVFALQLLKLAMDDYFMTVADYNRSQFLLFRALGYPANEIAILRPPGDIVPVDTGRPDYLPPVGNGPPPATR